MAVEGFADSGFRPSRLWVDAEISAGVSLEKLTDNYGICEPKSNLATSLLFSAGCYVCPELSLGLSSGVTTFVNPELSYIPVFFDIRTKPFAFDLMADLKLGTQIAFSGNNYFKRNFCAELFCGYTVLKRKTFHITPGIAYNYTGFTVKNTTPDYIPGCRNALSVKLSVGFGGY